MKEGWEYKKLGEVCEKTKNIKWDEHLNQQYKYIDLSAVDRLKHRVLSTATINSTNAPSRAKQIVKDGDVLFATTRPTLKRLVIVDKSLHEQICSTGFCVLRPNKDKIESSWLYYILSDQSFYNFIEPLQKGASYPAVTDMQVKSYLIPVPPLSEQQRIVSYLDSAFAKIDAVAKNAEASLNEAKALFQSALTKMMEPKEGWEKKKLKEVCAKITDGTHNSPINYHKGDYMYVTAKNIKEQGLDLSDITYVSKDVHEEIYARCNPEYGDVLYIKDGATAGIAIVNPLKEEFSLLSSVALLKPEHNIINGRFLCYALNSSYTKKILQSQMDGAAIRRVTLKKIKEFHLAFPTLNEQEYIVERLDSIKKAFQTLSSNLTRTLSECAALKQSILRQTFE